MSEINFPQFRELLLVTDRIPRLLNPNATQRREEFRQKILSGGIKTEEVTKCPCGSENLEKIANIDRFGLPFSSLICRDCGLVVTSPRMAAESLPEYYDSFYHTLNYGHLHMHEQQALFKLGQGAKIYNVIKPFIKGSEIKVLEIGAGTGNVLKELKDAAQADGKTITETGTEYSQDCLKECAENGVNAVYGDLTTMMGKGRFDLIILSHVFEHFIGLEEELEKIKALLNDGGLLYIEVPGLMNIRHINTYNFDFLEYLIHAHMYNFCESSLKNIVCRYGFKTLSINENVEALFTAGEAEKTDPTNNYKDIMEYLEKLVFCRTYLEDGIKSFRRGLNNTKEELSNVHRWHQHEKEEAEKFSRWHDAEKDRGDIARRWLAAEKKIAGEYTSVLDEYFKTPYTSLLGKIKKFRAVKALYEKYRKRYIVENTDIQ